MSFNHANTPRNDNIPHVSVPVTTGSPLAGSSHPASISLSPAVEIPQPALFGMAQSGGTVPPFYSQSQAAHLPGYKAWWLRKQARRHDLYKPTNHPTKRGDHAYYSPEHLYYIRLYLTNKKLTTEDAVYRAWMERNQNELSAALSPLRPPPAKRGRRAGS